MSAKHGDVATGPGWELRCGDYRDVLADVEPDAVITDPPYGARTHGGQRHGRRESGSHGSGNWVSTKAIHYSGWDSGAVHEFVGRWSGVPGWLCAFTSHDLVGAYQAGAEGAGRYVFAPVACVQVGMNVRLAGDGPSNWTTYLIPSRPRSLRRWGTLPGAYHGPHAQQEAVVPGAKPLWLTRAIVRDYSRPGDLVCDPCAGGGTTLLAAVLEGRRAIGAELDPVTFDKAVKRLRNHAITPPLPGIGGGPVMKQAGLFPGEEG